MNVGQIKAFLGDQNNSVHPDKALNKQLQEEGLRQATEFQQKQATSVTVQSTQTTIGLKIFSSALGQNVSLDGQSPKQEKADKEKEQASPFDFEKVAKNVMRFVGGVIQAAAKGGADEGKLQSLFSQAREGVARGIAMAEKDIGAMMNEDIENGISSSRDLIESKLSDLEKSIFGREDETQAAAAAATAIGASDSKSGELTIRTRDGDEVTLSFESLRQFQLQQQQAFVQRAESDSGEGGEPTSQSSSAYQYFERSGISFSLKGELDEDEMQAISDLVDSASDLADTFFSGDIDKAFEQALKMGYDDKELTGFAMQLNRRQQVEVVQAYESVQHYDDSKPDAGKFGSVVSPVAQYLDKMMDVFGQAREKLDSGESYNSLLNGLMTEMKDVQVPDLISAINRFHSFNQRLLDSMPASQSVGGAE